MHRGFFFSLSHTSCQELCEIPAITHDPRLSSERSTAALPRLFSVALVLLMLIAFAETGLAQTEMKDRYVTLAAGDQQKPVVAFPASDQYTVIVWEDFRDGQSDIYAQKLDNATGLALWDPIDGVPGGSCFSSLGCD